MSNCRIERKRAHDREAQRQSRAKTKAYIAHLEKTVADLSESNGDNRANYLAKHSSSQAQEIEALQAALSKIRTLVQDVTKFDHRHHHPLPSTRDVSSDDDHASQQQHHHMLPWDSLDDEGGGAAGAGVVDGEGRGQKSSSSMTRNLTVLGVNLECDDPDDTTYYLRVNEVLEKVGKTPDDLSNLEDDQDILVRAVVHGWDAAERMHHFDIVWRTIRAFDEGLWWRANVPSRLANFWSLRCMLLHKIQPRNQDRRAIPSFMYPTPRQLATQPHPAIADFFCWPELRDFATMVGAPEVPGRAVMIFAEGFRFHWPYALRDAYMSNTAAGGRYELSDRFLRHFYDITCFRVLGEPLSVHEPRIAWSTLGSCSEDSGSASASGPSEPPPPDSPIPTASLFARPLPPAPAADAAAAAAVAVQAPLLAGQQQQQQMQHYRLHQQQPQQQEQQQEVQVPPMSVPCDLNAPMPTWPFNFDLHNDPRLLLEYASDPMAINPTKPYSQWPPP